MAVREILLYTFIAAALTSCMKKNHAVTCIQFVHIGTTDRLNFSSVLLVEDSWCAVDVSDLRDTITVKKHRVSQLELEGMTHFLLSSELAKVPNREEPISGYEVVIRYANGQTKGRYIGTQDENDVFFSELEKHMRVSNYSEELMQFIEEVKVRGYYFYG